MRCKVYYVVEKEHHCLLLLAFGRGSLASSSSGNLDLGLGRGSLAFRTFDVISQAALSAVVTVEVKTHEDTGAALLVSAFTKKTGNLAGALIDLVVLKNGKFDLPVLVGDLLGLGVGLFLALLLATVEGKGAVVRNIGNDKFGVLGDTACSVQNLQLGGDTVGIGNDSFDISNAVSFNAKGAATKRLNKYTGHVARLRNGSSA